MAIMMKGACAFLLMTAAAAKPPMKLLSKASSRLKDPIAVNKPQVQWADISDNIGDAN